MYEEGKRGEGKGWGGEVRKGGRGGKERKREVHKGEVKAQMAERG